MQAENSFIAGIVPPRKNTKVPSFVCTPSPTFGFNADTGRLATVFVASLFFTVDATEGETRGAFLPLPALVEARVPTLPMLACDAESEKSSEASNPDPNNAFHLF